MFVYLAWGVVLLAAVIGVVRAAWPLSEPSEAAFMAAIVAVIALIWLASNRLLFGRWWP